MIDNLQLTDAYEEATLVDWTNGKPVIIVPSLWDADAELRFAGGWKPLKPYLRVLEQPKLSLETT